MTNVKLVLGLFVLVTIVIIVIAVIRRPNEGFNTGIAAADALATDRGRYIELSKQKYNKFSDSMDVQRGNFMRSDDPNVLAQATRDIQSAMRTSDLERTPDSSTFLGVVPDGITAQMPPANNVFTEAKKCEALRTRGSCANLSDPNYKNCGICIKEGSPYTFENQSKHIGGLLVLPDDRSDAEEQARISGSKVKYQPTVGECPGGFLHVDRATCEKEVNRQDCKEAGETGGFNVGVTAEGNKVANAKCAQVPTSGDSVFIYEAKTRTFDLGLRVLTPDGTGICKVFVYNSDKQQVGYNMSETPGKDFIVTVRKVKEGDKLSVIVVEEVPHRSRGQSEVFQYSLGGPKRTIPALCQRIGASVATLAQINNASNEGAQVCGNGWGADFYGYPSQATIPGACGKSNFYQTSENQNGASWCFGVKPPNSINTMINTKINNWFETYGASSVPPQTDMPTQWSKYGDYQAPAFRGVLLQWETADGFSTRTIPFQPTIVAVDNEVPSSSMGGSLVFKNLKLYGTFGNSTTIRSPKPSGNSRMLKNQFWIWGGNRLSQQVKFDVKVPGVFLNPVYPEDMAVAPRGTLIGDPATLALLKTSPCLKDGQVSGSYSIDCLTTLFVGAGGDLYNGKLATQGGLGQLNAMGDMDAIAGYLDGLYSMATTGKDVNGNRAPLDQINDAAQKMFGFDIATPCEDVVEDAKGNIGVAPKSGPVDADCLNFLWLNTNSDKPRGEEGGRKSTISNTYTSINDRFSGLRNSEGTKDSRKKYPFQACQLGGSKAPLNTNGTVNTKNVMEANAKGSIKGIQDFYNSIWATANYANSAGQSKQNAEAIQQCYGIEKTESIAPKSISGLVGWYIGTDPNGNGSVSNGQAIQRWVDKSDNNNDLVAKIPARSSSNGILFQNSFYISTKPMPYPVNVFVVVQISDLNRANDVIGFGQSNSDNFNSLTFGEYKSRFWHNGSSHFSRTPAAVANSPESSNKFLLMEWSIADGNFYINRNGVNIMTSNAYRWNPGSPHLTVGSRVSWNAGNLLVGVVSEIVVFGKQLMLSDRKKMENYLNQKWNIY